MTDSTRSKDSTSNSDKLDDIMKCLSSIRTTFTSKMDAVAQCVFALKNCFPTSSTTLVNSYHTPHDKNPKHFLKLDVSHFPVMTLRDGSSRYSSSLSITLHLTKNELMWSLSTSMELHCFSINGCIKMAKFNSSSSSFRHSIRVLPLPLTMTLVVSS